MSLEEAIRKYLESNYDSAIFDINEASEAMEVYITEHYIPDVIDNFIKE